MSKMEFLENLEESYNEYTCYNPSKSIQIFKCLLVEDDLEECCIYVSNKTNLSEVLDLVLNYLNWFSQCEKELRTFYERQLKETVSDEWFSQIEVYSVGITINSLSDYGATIHCGDMVILDHILQFYFEKETVIDVQC